MALPDSKIVGLVLNTPCSGIGHMKELLNTVMLRLSDCETNSFTKVA